MRNICAFRGIESIYYIIIYYIIEYLEYSRMRRGELSFKCNDAECFVIRGRKTAYQYETKSRQRHAVYRYRTTQCR